MNCTWWSRLFPFLFLLVAWMLRPFLWDFHGKFPSPVTPLLSVLWLTGSLCLCKLTEDLAKAKEAPPEFRVQMRDVSTNVGEPATFDCHVIGYPRPEVLWTKASLQLPISFALWRVTYKYLRTGCRFLIRWTVYIYVFGFIFFWNFLYFLFSFVFIIFSLYFQNSPSFHRRTVCKWRKLSLQLENTPSLNQRGRSSNVPTGMYIFIAERKKRCRSYVDVIICGLLVLTFRRHFCDPMFSPIMSIQVCESSTYNRHYRSPLNSNGLLLVPVTHTPEKVMNIHRQLSD